MATVHNFDQEMSAVTTADEADLALIHDTSASVKGYVTLSQIKTVTSAPVVTTATTLTVTAASHAGKTIVVNSTSPIAITLPQATGSGNRYRIAIGVVATATGHTIKVANATDNMNGAMAVFDTSATDITAIAFSATATDDTIPLNGTTQAGTVGTIIEIEDIKTGLFSSFVRGAATGSYATPFSATV